jgi:hypothetical protein
MLVSVVPGSTYLYNVCQKLLCWTLDVGWTGHHVPSIPCFGLGGTNSRVKTRQLRILSLWSSGSGGSGQKLTVSILRLALY